MPSSPEGLKIFESSFFHMLKRKFSGVNTTMITRRIGAENIAKRSGNSLATLFGEISPKISTTIVITTVEIVAP